jgi:hypothetical protein
MYTDPMWIMAHAVVCTEDGGQADGWSYEVIGEYGSEVTIWAGQHIDAGTAYLSFFEDENGKTYMQVHIVLNDGWGIKEDHLWIGTDCTSYPESGGGAPKLGWFPYGNTFVVPYPNEDTLVTDSLEDPHTYPHDVNYPGVTWADDMIHLCMILHVAIARDTNGDGSYDEHQTGFAWKPGTGDFPGNRWGGCYCFDVRRWEDGGGGGGGTCDTAWAFDRDGTLLNDDGSMIGDGTSQNEPGWFPTFFGQNEHGDPYVHRWGWVITEFAE